MTVLSDVALPKINVLGSTMAYRVSGGRKKPQGGGRQFDSQVRSFARSAKLPRRLRSDPRPDLRPCLRQMGHAQCTIYGMTALGGRP